MKKINKGLDICSGVSRADIAVINYAVYEDEILGKNVALKMKLPKVKEQNDQPKKVKKSKFLLLMKL
ncbi:hypothetical protein [Anaerosinus massiliensis]|uniref:hypothetical protein n=1 Tax=Massilibacillus massiliensis TaxID=1806837 RepID=UPI000DA5FCC7|nr:hypothetical protein [Massilibacillus massiliensis]